MVNFENIMHYCTAGKRGRKRKYRKKRKNRNENGRSLKNCQKLVFKKYKYQQIAKISTKNTKYRPKMQNIGEKLKKGVSNLLISKWVWLKDFETTGLIFQKSDLIDPIPDTLGLVWGF